MCDKKNYYKLGENIRGLRRMFGESQLDLATAIGVGTTAISNYEIGERNPDQDVLVRIAKHYRITEDELRNGDFSDIGTIKMADIRNPALPKKVLENIFPLVTSEVAMKNDNFKEAYNLHVWILNQILAKQDFDDEIITTCLARYQAAIEESVEEARINLLYWIFLQGIVFSLCTPSLVYMAENFDMSTLSSKTIMQGFLPSFDDAFSKDDEKEWERQKQEFREDNLEDVLVNIALLKKSKTYSEYGDYYLAWSYILGLSASIQTPQMSFAFGFDLLSTLSIIGNQYARNFVKSFENGQ